MEQDSRKLVSTIVHNWLTSAQHAVGVFPGGKVGEEALQAREVRDGVADHAIPSSTSGSSPTVAVMRSWCRVASRHNVLLSGRDSVPLLRRLEQVVLSLLDEPLNQTTRCLDHALPVSAAGCRLRVLRRVNKGKKKGQGYSLSDPSPFSS